MGGNSHDFAFIKSFLLTLFCTKRVLINCSCNPRKSSIGKHLELVSRSLDIFCSKYDNVILLGDFDIGVRDEIMRAFVIHVA